MNSEPVQPFDDAKEAELAEELGGLAHDLGELVTELDRELAEVDLDLTPLTVGFDLRLHEIAVRIPPDCASARALDETGQPILLRGRREQIAARLQDLGYHVEEDTP